MIANIQTPTCGWMRGYSSARSGLFVESTATRRTSPIGAAYSALRSKLMPPLRGLGFIAPDLATNMSLLAEFGFVTEHEVTT